MYDPSVIEEFARRLLRKAKSIVITLTLVGGAVGALVGLARENESSGMWAAAIGAVIGFAIGTEKAFQYRLAAQTALCHVMVEKNTRASAEALAHATLQTFAA